MTYVSALAPRAHQVEGLRLARGRREFGFVMEYGTGKSKLPLDEFGELEEAGEVKNLLIVAPAGCYLNWVLDRSEDQISEVRKNFSEDLFSRTRVAWWRSGAGKAHREGLRTFVADTTRTRVLVVNAEALSSVENARVLCREFLSAGHGMVVVDESTLMKNAGSTVSGVLVNLGKLASHRRILTGMMTPQSPLDLYAQFEFLNWRLLGYRSYYAFRARFAVMRKVRRLVPGKGGKFKEITQEFAVAYKNQEELANLVSEHTYRVLKKDVLDLPPKVYVRRDVELTDEQIKVYRGLLREAQAQLDSGEWVSTQLVLSTMLRLHQVLCGHVRTESGEVAPVSSNRLRVLREILGDHSGKAIVWAHYDWSVREIAAALREDYGHGAVACYWGGNRSTRERDQGRFLSDPGCRFMVSTQSSGGKGNTWNVANLEIYYANSYDLEDRMNSEDRPHRDGQTQSVTVVDLVAWGTVDEKILHALRRKIDIADAINRDGWREWVV